MVRTKQNFSRVAKLVSVSAVAHLREQTHLLEVVVSLLQSGEVSQEALILSPLLIQLRPKSSTCLRHSLIHALCTNTEEKRGRCRYKV